MIFPLDLRSSFANVSDPVPPRPLSSSTLRVPAFGEDERAALLATFESWRRPSPSSVVAQTAEELRERLARGSLVYMRQLFELLPADEAERSLFEALAREPLVIFSPLENELRVLLARFGERLFPAVERWAEPTSPFLLAAMGSRVETIVPRLSRLAWTWSRSKNRNHRNNVAWAIQWLREMASDEAIARLAIFAEGLGQASRRDERSVPCDRSRWTEGPAKVG